MRRSVIKLALRGGGALAASQQQAARVAAAASGLRFFADDANLKKTTLYDFHVAHGGEAHWRSGAGKGDFFSDHRSNANAVGGGRERSSRCALRALRWDE